MGDDPTIRNQVAEAFQRQFPGIRSDESDPEMVVFFTIVDYVPGCLPNCKKFRTYRNWTCEVEIFSVESASGTDTLRLARRKIADRFHAGFTAALYERWPRRLPVMGDRVQEQGLQAREVRRMARGSITTTGNRHRTVAYF